jgi:hypothetical protein
VGETPARTPCTNSQVPYDTMAWNLVMLDCNQRDKPPKCVLSSHHPMSLYAIEILGHGAVYYCVQFMPFYTSSSLHSWLTAQGWSDHYQGAPRTASTTDDELHVLPHEVGLPNEKGGAMVWYRSHCDSSQSRVQGTSFVVLIFHS